MPDVKIIITKPCVTSKGIRDKGVVVALDEKEARMLCNSGKASLPDLNSPSGDKKQGKKGGGNDNPPAPPADDNGGKGGGNDSPPA